MREREQMKKRAEEKLFLLGLIGAFIFLMACNRVSREQNSEDKWNIDLEGQWKVTDYLAGHNLKVSYDFYEHFLGRSIIIEPNRIIKSFGYWWNELNDVTSQYRNVEVEMMDGEVYGNGLGEEWHKKYDGQDIAVVTFDMPESSNGFSKSSFVVTRGGEVLCWYLGNIYYMERYKEAVTGLKEEQIYGQWQVKRLISYQDSWKGRNGLIDGKIYEEDEGGDFYPESYLGDMVNISKKSMEIYEGSRLLESIEINGYDSGTVDKYNYQNEKKIHDELGIINDVIQIFKGNVSKSQSSILDGEIVVINESEVIIKIYQGWYLLER